MAGAGVGTTAPCISSAHGDTKNLERLMCISNLLDIGLRETFSLADTSSRETFSMASLPRNRS